MDNKILKQFKVPIGFDFSEVNIFNQKGLLIFEKRKKQRGKNNG